MQSNSVYIMRVGGSCGRKGEWKLLKQISIKESEKRIERNRAGKEEKRGDKKWDKEKKKGNARGRETRVAPKATFLPSCITH